MRWPRTLASVQRGAHAYREYVRTDDPAHLRAAVRHFEHAARIAPRGFRARALGYAAMVRVNLHRHLPDGTGMHLQHAEEHIAAGLACDPLNSYDRSELLAAAADVARERYEQGDSLAPLDRAIALQEEHVALLDSFDRVSPTARAKAKANLAVLYSSRQARLGNIDDTQRAAQLAREAAALAPEDLGTALGAVKHMRNLVDDHRLDLQELAPATDNLRTVLERGAAAPLSLTIEAWRVLSMAERELASDQQPSYERRALHAAETMVALAVRRPAQLPAAWVCLAQAHQSRFMRTHATADLVEADSCMAQAQQTGGDQFWSIPPWMWIRAEIMFELADRTDDRGLAMAALNTYALGCRQAADRNPGLTLSMSYLWGTRAMQIEDWAQAVEAFEFTFDALQILRAAQLTLDDLHRTLTELEALGADASYAHAMEGDRIEAVCILEQALAVILTDRLGPDEDLVAEVRARADTAMADEFAAASAEVASLVRQLAQAGDRTPPDLGEQMRAARRRLQAVVERVRGIAGLEEFLGRPSISTVKAAASGQPLVYLIGGQRTGGAALIVRDVDEDPVEVVWLPQATFTQIHARVDAFTSAYAGRGANPIGWRKTLNETSAWLWDVAMGLVLDALPAGAGAVTLIPCGALRLLPWHAARAPGDGRRTYAADRVAISYNVNARYARWSQRSAGAGPPVAALIVERPLRADVPDLGHAGAEADAVARRVGTVTRLSGSAATRAAVLDALPRVDLVHFACHAAGDPSDPLETRVLLAGEDEITVRDLIGSDLNRVDLAVLSACESSMTGSGPADEAFALTTGLLAAGVPSGIGSLWAVNDAAAAALIDHFYAELSRGQPTAQALRRAQLAIREHTKDGRRPWSDPYYWAPFVLVGA